MSTFQNIQFLVFFLLFFTTTISFTTAACTVDGSYIIKNQQSGLVVDGSERQAKIQTFTGTAAQTWIFECGNRPGYYYIVNSASGNVLGLEEIGTHTPMRDPVLVIPRVEKDLLQQWVLNSGGYMVNVGTLIELDVLDGDLTPGAPLQIFQRLNVPGQQFIVEEKM